MCGEHLFVYIQTYVYNVHVYYLGTFIYIYTAFCDCDARAEYLEIMLTQH